VVLLPFFTLAGASLQLSSLTQVLPAALALVVLRALGVAVGSTGAGFLSRIFFPESQTTKETVGYTWLTLLAQAGVTLGLVLEVQHSFSEPWTQPFATLIISVVVINQLLGPVCCRFGLQTILEAERLLADGKDLELGSDSSSERSGRWSNSPRSSSPENDRSPMSSTSYVPEPAPPKDRMLQKLNQF